jgi:uncharacterized protein YjbI with pentapeptide repeats
MANKTHVEILHRGRSEWNLWRQQNPLVVPDLSGIQLETEDLQGFNLSGVHFQKANFTCANLSNVDLSGASLRKANLTNGILKQANLNDVTLRGAVLNGTNFFRASLKKADLRGVNLAGADLSQSLLQGANLSGAKGEVAKFVKAHLHKVEFRRVTLPGADFTKAQMTKVTFNEARLQNAVFKEAIINWSSLSRSDFTGADFSGSGLRGSSFSRSNLMKAVLTDVDLAYARLVDVNLTGAYLADCLIFGISAWNVTSSGSDQLNLTITRGREPKITVDNLEVAQFIYLLLNNKKIRDVIETIGKKAVLILGNFKPNRKVVLEAIRDELRLRGYLPILFDFDVPSNRDTTETISALAHLCRFIIADITDARSIPQELQAIVPNLPSIPVMPVLLSSQREYGMFDHLKRYPQVLETHFYDDIDELLFSLATKVIEPAEARAEELTS